MHHIIIDASKLGRLEWQTLCGKLDRESRDYTSTSQDYKIYITCASVSQMADIVEFIREETDLN